MVLLFTMTLMQVFNESLVKEDKVQDIEKIDISELSIDETWKLPIIRFEKNEKQPLDEEFYMDMYVYDDFSEDGLLVNYPSGKYETKLKYRGSSSATFPKKQMRVIVEDDTIELLGMPSDSKWVLNGPYLDKSYMRNEIMYEIFRDVLEWGPNAEYCEVFIEGEYLGIYLLIEFIDKSENRLDLHKFGMLNGQIPYIVKRDRVDDASEVIKTFGSINNYTINNLILVEPKPDKIIEKHKNWIIESISDFEKALFSEDFKNKLTGYSRHIDVDNFVDYYVISLFSVNHDAGDLSTFIYKDLDEPIKIAPWDYNNIFGNSSNKDFTYFSDEMYNWYSRLLEDPYFRKNVIKRYKELRYGILSDESFEKIVLKNKKILEHASLRNTIRWYGTNKIVDINYNINNDDFYEKYYDERVEQLITFAKARGKFLDENLEMKLESIFNKN